MTDCGPGCATSPRRAEESRIEALDEEVGIAGMVEIVAGKGNLPMVHIKTDVVQARLYLYGAQITSWIPAGMEEILFLSSRSPWEAGQPIRGGIPICFPWFSSREGDPQASRHGFVRTREWQIDSIQLHTDGSVTVVCATDSDAGSLACWPYRYRAVFSATFGKTLRMEFTVINRDSTTFSFEEALHTYFRAGCLEAIAIHGLEGATYFDYTDGCRPKVQEGPVNIGSVTDRVYTGTDRPLALHDARLRRTIRITSRNVRSAIVWNPWNSKTEDRHDLAAGEWPHMICVETGNVLGDRVCLAAGEQWSMCTTLSADPQSR